METFQTKALEVPLLDDNFDPNKEPENGEEFLMKVIYERKQCPTVVVREITKKQKENSTFEDVKTMDDIVDTIPLRQTKEWKFIQLQKFTVVREKISFYRQKMKENFNDYNDEFFVPINDGEDACKIFCYNNKPLLSIILKINQKDLEQLLEYQLQWLYECLEIDSLNLSTTEAWLGSWIYSVMVCLIIPLEPSVYSVLRDIGKICIQNRRNLKDDDSKINIPFNIFISIISTYFGQLDMAEYV